MLLGRPHLGSGSMRREVLPANPAHLPRDKKKGEKKNRQASLKLMLGRVAGGEGVTFEPFTDLKAAILRLKGCQPSSKFLAPPNATCSGYPDVDFGALRGCKRQSPPNHIVDFR